MIMSELLSKDEVYAIVGAAMEVHTTLGCGFLEAVYQEAMEIELAARGILFQALVPIRIRYKNHLLKKEYVADLICFGEVIVELKAIDRITSKEEAQLLNYLKATGFRVGIVINFGVERQLDWKRMVR